MRVVPRIGTVEIDESRQIERVLTGDTEAFGYFVRAYQQKIFGLSLRLLRDRGEAENVAQEAFIKAYQALGDFRGGSSFETWITRIAVNACRDRLKRKKLVLFFHQSPEPPGLEDEGNLQNLAASTEPDPERLLLSHEIRARLVAAVGALSARQKVAFMLKHFDEKSIPEIAQIMGLDIGTVKSHLFRAAARVRGRLADLRRGQ